MVNSTRPRWVRIFLIVVAGSTASLALGLGLFLKTSGANFDGFRISLDGIRLSRNFSEVGSGGQFFRSAQLTADELEQVVTRYGIKTVINLQGSRPGYEWYDDEQTIIKKMNLVHYDFGLSTETIPKSNDLRDILTLLHTAPKPILLHCRSGSDRTGLISAIYAYDFLHESKIDASKQISERFWHIRMITPAQDYFFWEVYKNEEWAMKIYSECDSKLQYADRSRCLNP